MPVIKDFRIVDDFYLWEAIQGINNGRTIIQFRIVDNYYLYLEYLALFALLPPLASTPLFTFRIPLTAAQIKTLNSIPVLAVAAPGIGFAIQMICGSINYTFNTAVFSNDINVESATTTGASQLSSTSIQVAASMFDVFQIVGEQDTDVIQENEDMNITASADSLVGDGSAIIYGMYRVITV